MSGEPVCARCPRRLGRSCCEPAEGEHLATLTTGDVARIAAHTGRSRRYFVEEEWLTHDEALTYERVRPLFAGYFANGPLRLTLRRAPTGACVFHAKAGGCTLEESVRPLACRLYPFERLADGSWSVAVGRGEVEGGGADRTEPRCLAVEESGSLEELEQAFSLDAAARERLASQLLTEARTRSATADRLTR